MSNEADFFLTIGQTSTAEFKDRGSRFIAHAFPIETADDFKAHLQSLKKEHAKAVHHCFAYRLGTGEDNFRSSDDGEPSGTAGRPILGQIDSRNLTNTAVIVVRYFGGTLLGVPGLINAYKTATALVLQTIPVTRKQVEQLYRIQFEYSQVNEVMQVLKNGQCSIYEQDFHLFPVIKAGIPNSRLEEVKHKLDDIRSVEINNM